MFAASSAQLAVAPADTAFARDVAEGLGRKRQKTLPATWFYDEVGSALFEVITLLPEYGLTRADARLIDQAGDEIVRAACRPRLIIELGSGAGTKTRPILRAAAKHGPVEYRPIDVSRAALAICASALGGIDWVRIDPIESTYLKGIDLALAGRYPGERALILFLGSTIGNFNRPEAASFLKQVRRRMQTGDSLLLGTDLVKSRTALLVAYDDPLGVTAAFNLNVLARINRELDGEFELHQFAHEARYNERQSRIEMHLRSRIAQTVRIGEPGIEVSFRAGETIWTESSHKFRTEEIAHMGERAGWSSVRQWVDREWGFAETLFVAQ